MDKVGYARTLTYSCSMLEAESLQSSTMIEVH